MSTLDRYIRGLAKKKASQKSGTDLQMGDLELKPVEREGDYPKMPKPKDYSLDDKRREYEEETGDEMPKDLEEKHKRKSLLIIKMVGSK